MNFSESLSQAWESLKSNKLRSILTMLGIVMGVFSVITIITIGNAAQAYMNAQFEKLGANIIQVSHSSKATESNDWLQLEDVETIKKAIPEIKSITASFEGYGETRIGKSRRNVYITGDLPQGKAFGLLEIMHGRYITDSDISARSNVIIVPESFAKKYYKRSDIVGETMTLKNPDGASIKLKIVGITKSEGNMFESMLGDDAPVIAYMPATTVQQFFGAKRVSTIQVAISDKSKLQDVGNRIIKLLSFKHKNTDKYVAQNSADMQKSLSDIMGVLSTILLVIAIITLIVGGIGIVNILLVSVTERIREIGIRKALGAQKRDIVMQFITESILMTASSGLVGIGLGIGSGLIIASVITIPPTVDWVVVILSFLGSVALGMIFGVYPAKKAADMDPIECLRYE